MRQYSCDSPQAAARIVAIVLLADGHVGKHEFEALERAQISQRLGLRAGELATVLQTMCEDLTSTAYLCWSEACRVEPDVIRFLAAEVQDIRLRRTVMDLCKTVVHADGHLSEGEVAVLRALYEAWHLPVQAERRRERLVLA